MLLKCDAANEAAWMEERFGPIAFVVKVADTAAGIALSERVVNTHGALTVGLYTTQQSVIDAMTGGHLAQQGRAVDQPDRRFFRNQSARIPITTAPAATRRRMPRTPIRLSSPTASASCSAVALPRLMRSEHLTLAVEALAPWGAASHRSPRRPAVACCCSTHVKGAAAEAKAALGKQWGKLVEKGKMAAAAAEAAQARLEIVADAYMADHANVVVEAIVENLDVKRALFRELDEIVSADCVMATNTSSLSVTAIAAGTKFPGRVAGFHFFNPVPLMKVVEVVAGALTDEAPLELLTALAREWGHTPVRAQDTPGFIVNHAGRGYVTEALAILRECVAEVPVIDAILREAAGFRLGPSNCSRPDRARCLAPGDGVDLSPVLRRPALPAVADRRAAVCRRACSAARADAASIATTERRIRKRWVPGAAPWAGPVWVSDAHSSAAEPVRDLLRVWATTVETGLAPSAEALIVVTPPGTDVSACIAAERLDAKRTIGIDTCSISAGAAR